MLRMLTVLTFPMDTIQHLWRSFDEFLSFYECFNKYYECINSFLERWKSYESDFFGPRSRWTSGRERFTSVIKGNICLSLMKLSRIAFDMNANIKKLKLTKWWEILTAFIFRSPLFLPFRLTQMETIHENIMSKSWNATCLSDKRSRLPNRLLLRNV